VASGESCRIVGSLLGMGNKGRHTRRRACGLLAPRLRPNDRTTCGLYTLGERIAGPCKPLGQARIRAPRRTTRNVSEEVPRFAADDGGYDDRLPAFSTTLRSSPPGQAWHPGQARPFSRLRFCGIIPYGPVAFARGLSTQHRSGQKSEQGLLPCVSQLIDSPSFQAAGSPGGGRGSSLRSPPALPRRLA
jgi:hypothetical protein